MNIFFFAAETDMKLLLRLCEEQKLGVIPTTYKIGKEPVIESAVHYEPGEAAFALLPREYTLDDVIYNPGSKGKAGIATIDLETAPVIICEPPVLWGTKLDVGEFSVADEMTDRRFTLVERRYDFLSRTIRRWAKTDKNQGHVGPETERLVKQKKLQLGLGKRSVELW
ncbi:MAG: hypothetical protein IT381_18315 [Deltaproteobacteria bacterium]|nr:hypothetical protein [Deltaproteobacteria bacterium]